MEKLNAFANQLLETTYANLNPAEVWRHFAHLNAIARPSGHETAARDYVQLVANSVGATSQSDDAGNLVVRLNARAASTDAPTVALQSHLDMVSEKRPDIAHDFLQDPIRAQRQNNRISATGTTLGADNGIGAAMMLAVLTNETIAHGPLELLFTVQEETGLDGALGLDAELLNATLLLNLDSEDPEEITIGCAGGRGMNLEIPFPTTALPANYVASEIIIGGLQGGHSGVQINEPLGNAIKILAQTLRALSEAGVSWRLIALDGGNMRNAIPRDARATIAFPDSQRETTQIALQTVRKYLQETWQHNEANLSLDTPDADAQNALNTANSNAILQLLEALPHGVLQMSERFSGKVETSCNLATAKTQDGALHLHISGRSFRESALDAWQEQIENIAARFPLNIGTQRQEGYPGWEPAANAQLLQSAQEVYQAVYGRAAKIEIVHAGLECGILLSKRPQMEAISFGPLIRGAHTPEEWVEIESVEQSWQFLRALLADLAQP